MKLYCPKSDISYTTNIGYGHGKVLHPIFHLPLKALIMQHLDAAVTGKLSKDETHLLGCALLDKLPVHWRVPLHASRCFPYWRGNLEKLCTIVTKYSEARHKGKVPEYIVDKHNCDLSGLNNYLDMVANALREANGGAVTGASSASHASLAGLDAGDLDIEVLRLIRKSMQSTKMQKMLPEAMADWAATVGKFPSTIATINATTKLPLDEYWKSLVASLFRSASPVEILSTDVTKADIEELAEHCEQHIEVGSVHSVVLFRKLREAISILDEFRPDKIDNPADLLLADADSPAPEKAPSRELLPGEPARSSYATMAAYLAAKIAWNDSRKSVANAEKAQ